MSDGVLSRYGREMNGFCLGTLVRTEEKESVEWGGLGELRWKFYIMITGEDWGTDKELTPSLIGRESWKRDR